MPAGRKPCPRCEGLRMQDAAARAALLQTYVESLPPAERVPPEVYERRLSRCMACPHLLEDLCVLCGCYARVRAAKARLGCPDVQTPRWTPRLHP